MKRLVVVVLAGLAASSAVADDCRLQGVWKSDAARTLASINATTLDDPATLNAVSDDLFGHMMYEWTCSDYRAWFDIQAEGEPVGYETAAESESSTTVKVAVDPEFLLVIEWQGECYRLPVAGHDFYEYFCPLDRH